MISKYNKITRNITVILKLSLYFNPHVVQNVQKTFSKWTGAGSKTVSKLKTSCRFPKKTSQEGFSTHPVYNLLVFLFRPPKILKINKTLNLNYFDKLYEKFFSLNYFPVLDSQMCEDSSFSKKKKICRFGHALFFDEWI